MPRRNRTKTQAPLKPATTPTPAATPAVPPSPTPAQNNSWGLGGIASSLWSYVPSLPAFLKRAPQVKPKAMMKDLTAEGIGKLVPLLDLIVTRRKKQTHLPTKKTTNTLFLRQLEILSDIFQEISTTKNESMRKTLEAELHKKLFHNYTNLNLTADSKKNRLNSLQLEAQYIIDSHKPVASAPQQKEQDKPIDSTGSKKSKKAVKKPVTKPDEKTAITETEAGATAQITAPPAIEKAEVEEENTTPVKASIPLEIPPATLNTGTKKSATAPEVQELLPGTENKAGVAAITPSGVPADAAQPDKATPPQDDAVIEVESGSDTDQSDDPEEDTTHTPLQAKELSPAEKAQQKLYVQQLAQIKAGFDMLKQQFKDYALTNKKHDPKVITLRNFMQRVNTTLESANQNFEQQSATLLLEELEREAQDARKRLGTHRGFAKGALAATLEAFATLISLTKELLGLKTTNPIQGRSEYTLVRTFFDRRTASVQIVDQFRKSVQNSAEEPKKPSSPTGTK